MLNIETTQANSEDPKPEFVVWQRSALLPQNDHCSYPFRKLLLDGHFFVLKRFILSRIITLLQQHLEWKQLLPDIILYNIFYTKAGTRNMNEFFLLLCYER